MSSVSLETNFFVGSVSSDLLSNVKCESPASSCLENDAATVNKLSSVPNESSSLTSSNLGSTSSVRRSNRGKGKLIGQSGLDEKIDKYCASDGTEYQKEDTVYLEDVNHAEKTYSIGVVEFFRLSRRLDGMHVHVKLFYRKNDVPDSLYGALCERESVESRDIRFADPSAKHRELLISEALSVMPVCALRGKCKVEHFAEMRDAAAKFQKVEDNFFFVFSYNPETRRLASTRAEIRMGPRYQVDPPCVRSREAHLALRMKAAAQGHIADNHWEELRWTGPDAIFDDELVQYLRAARSIAAFHGLCDLGCPVEGKSTAETDETTQYAYDMLHDMDYQRALALMVLAKNPYPQKKGPRLWTHDDVRAFSRAMRIHNKNFYRMHCESLPHKSVKELILFYYLWKKTSSCTIQKSQTRSCTARKRERCPTPTGSNSTVGNSDIEDITALVDEDEEEEKVCRNCLVPLTLNVNLDCVNEATATEMIELTNDAYLSNRTLTPSITAKRDPFCKDCRVFYQKYGQERLVNLVPREVDGECASTLTALDSAVHKKEFSVISSNEVNEPVGSASASTVSSSSEDSDEDGGSSDEENEIALLVQHGDLMPVKLELPSPTLSEPIDSSKDEPIALVTIKQELVELVEPIMTNTEDASCKKDVSIEDVSFESDNEDVHVPTASPPPVSCLLDAHRSKNVALCRVWSRSHGKNSCARVDLVPKVPSSRLEQARIQRQHSAPVFGNSAKNSGAYRMPCTTPNNAEAVFNVHTLSQIKRESRRSTPPTSSALASVAEANRLFEAHSAQHLLSTFARPHLVGNNGAAPGTVGTPHRNTQQNLFGSAPLPPPGTDPSAYYRNLMQMGMVPSGDPRFEMERKYHEIMLEQQQIQEMMMRGAGCFPQTPHGTIRAPFPQHSLGHEVLQRGATSSTSAGSDPSAAGSNPFDSYMRQLAAAAHAQHLALAQHHHHNHTHLHLHQPVPPPHMLPAQQEAFEYYRYHAEMANAASRMSPNHRPEMMVRGPPQSGHHNMEQFDAAAMNRFGGMPGFYPMIPGHDSVAALEAMFMEQQMRASMGLPPL